MNYYRFSNNSGFALGMILLVIALIAAISASVSLSGNTSFARVNQMEKSKSYGGVLKSYGELLRQSYRQMLRNGFTPSGIDYAAACTGSSDCLAPNVKYTRFEREIFHGSPEVLEPYAYWAFHNAAAFPNSPENVETLVALLNHPIKTEYCLSLMSNAAGRKLEAADIPFASNFVLNAAQGTFSATFAFQPPAVDGCFGVSGGGSDVYYYYYIILGEYE